MASLTNAIMLLVGVSSMIAGGLTHTAPSLAYVKQFITKHNRAWMVLTVFLFTVSQLWLYNQVRTFQQHLEAPKRLQRICGENAFEKETIRWSVREYSNSNDLDKKIIGLVLCCIALGLAVFLIPSSLISDSTFVLYVIIVALSFAYLNLVHSKLGYLAQNKIAKHDLVIKYTSDLNTIKEFVRVSIHSDNYQPNGAYRRLRENILKRIILESNFESVKDAEDAYASFVKSDINVLLGYIEFHEDRDYIILKEMMENMLSLSADDKSKITSSLENLKLQSTYDFITTFHESFKLVNIAFVVLAFVLGYIWTRILSTSFSYSTTIIAFVFAILVITYAMS